MKTLKLFLIGIFLLNATYLFADIYMKQKTTTSGFSMMGQTQPGEEKVQEIWLAKDKIATVSEDEAMIMENNSNKMIFINHTNKSYAEMVMDMDTIAAQSGEEMDEEEKAAMKNMMAAMGNIKITITPTSETKKIGKWNCKKYIQKMEIFTGPIVSEMWVTNQIKIDYDQYAKFMTSMISKMPGMKQAMANYMQEIKKMKGVAVLTTSTNKIMGQEMKSSTELLEFKEGKAPANVFKIPAGYKKARME